MDKMLYLAMSGAKENMHSISVHANNLANASRTGFRADLEQARAMQAYGEGHPSRVFALTERPASDFSPGPLQTTGRDLDVAVAGDGWLTVQAADGTEAYTRAGDLRIGNTGLLENGSGQLVMGDGGPILLPLPIEKIQISADGTVTVQPQGAPANALEDVGRLKLVNPPHEQLTKGEDGLFRQKDGEPAFADAMVRVQSGVLEGSNVNAIGSMTNMISLQRQFEMQVKMMKTAEENDSASNQLLRMS